jgi:amino acid transporter
MSGKMGLWGAVSIAVGTMIGASIFSVFGLGARIAGHNLPFVFVVSGVLALLVAYSYATLGSKIVSNAGPIEFVLRGFGDGLLAGTLSILTWFTYVVSIALFAKGFSGYFLPLVGLAPAGLAQALVETGVIALFAALGLLGSGAVGRAESIIVLVKLSVLGVFVVLGLWTLRPGWIAPGFSAHELGGTLDAAAIFFLSYMGFGLVTNASENMKDPERNVPRAIYLSVLIVSVVYILVAAVAVGNVELEKLVEAEEFALAEAAKPFLGSLGYLLVSLGALFSISSALNATLYGGANIAYALAKDGELPEVFERKAWFGASEGLYFTAGLGMVLAVVFDVGAIASITSAVFMALYLFVLLSHARIRKQFGGSRALIVLGIVAVLAVFVILMVYEWKTDRPALYGTWIAFAAAFLVEVAYRRFGRRQLAERERGGGSPGGA